MCFWEFSLFSSLNHHFCRINEQSKSFRTYETVYGSAYGVLQWSDRGRKSIAGIGSSLTFIWEGFESIQSTISNWSVRFIDLCGYVAGCGIFVADGWAANNCNSIFHILMMAFPCNSINRRLLCIFLYSRYYIKFAKKDVENYLLSSVYVHFEAMNES